MSTIEQLMILPLLSFIVLILLLKKWRSSACRKNLPPSPKGLPVIGNLHLLGTSPHRSLQSLSRRYGHEPLLLRFGRVPVLLVSTAEAACEVMKNQDTVFSSRPKLSMPDRLIYGSKDVAFSAYGEYWRQVRSICVVQLLSNRRVQSFRHVREQETSDMVEKIRRQSSAGVINLTHHLSTLTNDIICRAAFGRKCIEDNGEDRKFRKFMKEFNDLLGTTNLGEFIPWLGWINRVNGLDARVERTNELFDGFLESMIQEHKEDYDKKKSHDNEDKEPNFIDVLLQLQRESLNGSSPIGDDTIKALILDMFAAGTDTTVTAFEWALAELLKNPRTMKTLQNEVRRVAGNRKFIAEDDLPKMPYLKAVMKEAMRLHIPVPLLVPRECTRDTKLMGYDIAARTRVLINAWAIARDPTTWENPEDFRPERFLDSQIDFGGQHFEFIPFGAGRRGCPGMTFAMAVNELGLAKLLHHFNFSLPDGERGEDLDMGETSGITVHKKLPMLVVATAYI